MATTDWDPRELQEAIQAWLDRTGMSQNQAALLTGISQGVFNRWLQPSREYGLVQPQPPQLMKLAPHIGIDHDELMRMAGHRMSAPAQTKPRALIELFRALENGYNNSVERSEPPEIIEMRIAQTLSLWPIHPRRRSNNRRIKGNNTGLDNSKMDYEYVSKHPVLAPA